MIGVCILKSSLKKLASIISVLAICLWLTPSVFASAADLEPNSVVGPTLMAIEITNYDILKNKMLVSTAYKKFDRYITTTWAKSPNYNVSKQYTISLSTEPMQGTFLANVVKNFGFTASVTSSVATDIYADQTRYSKLTLAKDERKYSVQLYHVTEYASGSKTETFTGSGNVYEPFDTYYVVIYQ